MGSATRHMLPDGLRLRFPVMLGRGGEGSCVWGVRRGCSWGSCALAGSMSRVRWSLGSDQGSDLIATPIFELNIIQKRVQYHSF